MMGGGVSAWSDWMWLGACVSVLAALLVFGVMAATTLMRQYSGRDESGAARSPGPQRILDERLASGEISEDEYLQREAMLRGTR